MVIHSFKQNWYDWKQNSYTVIWGDYIRVIVLFWWVNVRTQVFVMTFGCSFSVSKPILLSELPEVPLALKVMGKSESHLSNSPQVFIIVYFGLRGLSWKICCNSMSFSVIKGKLVKFLTAETWFEDWETNYTRCGVFKGAVCSISSFHVALLLFLPSRKMKRTLREKSQIL